MGIQFEMMSPALVIRYLYVVCLCGTLLACGGNQAVAPLGRHIKKQSPSLSTPRPLSGIKIAVPKSHRVGKGESLYAIAWIYNLDYQDIAAWNTIAEPYTIYPGQQLRLFSNGQPVSSRKTPKPNPRPQYTKPSRTHTPTSSPTKKVVAKPRVKPRKSTVKYTGANVKRWQWPSKGKVIGKFSKSGGKGINIQGRRGQPVISSAPGRVVYSGSGLRGYGKLIIIKHNSRYLSAYAHNQELQVGEGDIVKAGQQIAQMGNSESRVVKLHFEIRRDGKPVNPLQHLP